MGDFTHFDQNGNAVMVDISEKSETERTAIARGEIQVNEEIIDAIMGHKVKKGDVLGVARVAGIMAAKQTSSLIPMCHPLFLANCTIEFEIDKKNNIIHGIATTRMKGKTGVEMESLTAVSVALLTIYDMCKAIDKSMVISGIHLVKKTGGKSNTFYNERM